jgi:mRNA guanylyltransferase
MPHPIPNIPGEPASPDIAYHLSNRVAELCGLRQPKFPGSQPVSFTTDSLAMLENMDFWVCEKSDGVRVLLYVVLNPSTGEQEVWLVCISSFSHSRPSVRKFTLTCRSTVNNDTSG